MKIVRIVLASSLLLSTLAACSDNPNVDFWGNPITPPGASCDVPATTDPRPVTDVSHDAGPEGWKNRPAFVAPGNAWILVGVNVRALDPVEPGDRENYCVPVNVRIEIDTIEQDAQLNGREDGRIYDFDSLTPWLHHYVPFDYDPSAERFRGRPPQYVVKVTATYVPGPNTDAARWPSPREMICDITIWGASVASARLAPADGGVYCSLVKDTYDRFDQYQ